MAQDPYTTLGVSPSATDAELRSAYRRLVQLHHPDHNHGSPEAARRFEAVQEAYARVREMRAGGKRTPPPRASRRSSTRTPPPRTAPRPPSDPEVDSRLADLERELREAQAARQRAEQAARDAAREAARAASAQPLRPGQASDDELGYINTDDSFSKILSDARKEVADRFAEVRGSPEAKRAADLIDELGALLRGERGNRSDKSD
jgi:curved DNA-binding protein CbpA